MRLAAIRASTTICAPGETPRRLPVSFNPGEPPGACPGGGASGGGPGLRARGNTDPHTDQDPVPLTPASPHLYPQASLSARALAAESHSAALAAELDASRARGAALVARVEAMAAAEARLRPVVMMHEARTPRLKLALLRLGEQARQMVVIRSK